MRGIFEKVNSNPLFKGIDLDSFEGMLTCIEGRVQVYKKNEIIQLAGSAIKSIGIVALGAVQIIREDIDGKHALLNELSSGEIFGEVFACAGILYSPMTVIASEDCEILHLNYHRIITACPSSCVFHHRLIENMLTLMAQKNLMLNHKLELLSKRTTRERLLIFFDQQCRGISHLTAPFSHGELAAYLCVERSAMSAELSKMRRDGLIFYHKKNRLYTKHSSSNE